MSMVDSAKSMTGGGGPMQPGMDQSMVTAGPGSYNPNQEAFQPQAPVGGLVNEQSEPINGGVAQVQPVQPIQTPNAPVPQDPQTDCKFKIATSELAPFFCEIREPEYNQKSISDRYSYPYVVYARESISTFK